MYHSVNSFVQTSKISSIPLRYFLKLLCVYSHFCVSIYKLCTLPFITTISYIFKKAHIYYIHIDHSPAKMGKGDLSSSATSKFRSNINNNNSSNKVWTNERHVDYLNSMEASFVRSMLNSLPMNRDVPDISDSTLDHRSTPRARRYSTSGTNLLYLSLYVHVTCT